MDKAEAYSIVVEALRAYTDLGKAEARTMIENEPEALEQGASGKLYTMNFRLEKDQIIGSIHDQNSAKFILLEERMDFRE